MPCTEGSVTAVSDVDNSRFQLVEMCGNNTFFQNVWHPVCDSDWTQQDASVVCRELGYTSLGMSYIGILLANNIIFKLL